MTVSPSTALTTGAYRSYLVRFWSSTVEDYLHTSLFFTNNAGATVNSTFILDVRDFTNAGVINVSGRGMTLSNRSTNRSTGQIRVRSGGTLTVSPRFGSLTNEGTIIICRHSFHLCRWFSGSGELSRRRNLER